MDMEEENSYMRASKMPPPPSRIPSPGKYGLAEITDSQSNIRSKPSMLPPPPSLKHKLGAYAEPEPKRKTLVERAGEPRSIATATPGPRSIIKGQSLVGANTGRSGHSRNASYSSSISSKTPSVSSRNTSSSSFSISVGPGPGRPATSYGNRPQSSMAFSQSTTTRPLTCIPKSRPATSMDMHEEFQAGGTRDGTEPLNSISYSTCHADEQSTVQGRKIRAPQSTHLVRSSKAVANRRDVSVSTAMSRLNLDGEVWPSDSHEHQAISSTHKPNSTSALRHKSSISTGLRSLRFSSDETAPALLDPFGDNLVPPKTPSQIYMFPKEETKYATPAARRTPRPSPQKTPFLTKDSNMTSFIAFDVRGRLENMEASFNEMKEKFKGTAAEQKDLEDMLSIYKNKMNDAENLQSKLTFANTTLQGELDAMRHKADILQQQLLTSSASFNEQILVNQREIIDVQREHRKEIENLRRDNADEADRLDRLYRDKVREQEQRAESELQDRLRDLERRYDAKLEDERSRSLREIQDLQSKIVSENTNLDLAMQKKDREIENMRGELERVRGEVDREQKLKNHVQEELDLLKQTVQKTRTETSSTISSLEGTVASLRARIHFLESGSKAQSDSFADMEARLQEAVRSAEESKRKLIKEETIRRILFNQVQELKGNIRVMCRVRPASDNAEGDIAKITYPDVDKESKELEIVGKEEKSSLGKIIRKTHAFTFDRVFGPESQNQEVFEEISQLVQSALDGYNVCIFAYGQTGAGKTHTMSSRDGMIPRATQQIYETATNLKEKGWTYTMEGSFVEVYNEEIHDLLGGSKDFDKAKHEIRHDDQKKQTMVTGLKTVMLDSPDTVESMMKQAANNRSVAATKSNERSSRSHSVFILKLVGRNSTTNETSEGTLNLVDLAGSERLKQSGAEGDRMKETQNINKSLSCLGDVIGALGQGKEGAHIPYRNSKLTYLLQYSLGGNSKTLMFVMTSPLEAHLNETLTSLKFATKVHNTHIGTAKKTKKVTERSNDS